MDSRLSAFLVVACAVPLSALAVACDTDSSKGPAPESASAAVSPTQTPPPPPKPPEPTAPQIVVDDAQCTIDGEVVPFNAPDPAGRIATTLSGKPFVEGQVVAISASRDVKVPKVAFVVQALKKAKAKSALVKSQRRDSNMGELEIAVDHPAPADCSATGMINKDGSIAVWAAGGGGAKRFARGFAGPDMTLGSQAIQKQSSGCDSPVWFVAADDGLPWGLAFDLALTSIGSGDGGALRATKTVLLGPPPVAGRKVTEN